MGSAAVLKVLPNVLGAWICDDEHWTKAVPIRTHAEAWPTHQVAAESSEAVHSDTTKHLAELCNKRTERQVFVGKVVLTVIIHKKVSELNSISQWLGNDGFLV